MALADAPSTGPGLRPEYLTKLEGGRRQLIIWGSDQESSDY